MAMSRRPNARRGYAWKLFDSYKELKRHAPGENVDQQRLAQPEATAAGPVRMRCRQSLPTVV